MSNIAVFGANGFIGKHLIRALARDPENIINAFGHFSQYKLGEAESPFVDLRNVNLVPGDLFNKEEVLSALKDVEYVFHFISATNPATSNNDPMVDIDTNVRASIELLELCAQSGVKRVIFPSSGGTVYGDIDSDKIDELTMPRPRSPYGIGKLTVEHYLRYFKFSTGMDYVVFRIANPYGPGQNIHGKQGVIPIFMHQSLTGGELSIYGDGSMIRDYVYIDDLVTMIIKAYDQPHKFDEYNLGSGNGMSVNQIIEHVERCHGSTVTKRNLETPKSFVHKSVLDMGRYNEEFGSVELTPVDIGFNRTWEYVRHRI